MTYFWYGSVLMGAFEFSLDLNLNLYLNRLQYDFSSRATPIRALLDNNNNNNKTEEHAQLA